MENPQRKSKLYNLKLYNLKLIILRLEMGVVYCLTFPNGKKYIGQTKQRLETRLKQHSKQKYCKAVHNAICKYLTYTCDILLKVNDFDLDYYEEKMIKEYKTLVPNGYNIREGGKKSSFCDETKKQMSYSHKGKKQSDETKKAISNALTGRVLSEETKQKISYSKKKSIISEKSKIKMNRIGMKHTEDSKLKISNFNKGKKIEQGTREKLSRSLRYHGKDLNLPLYMHRKEQNQNSYHGSGYVIRVPGFKSKSFISKKISDDEKYKLALEYLKTIQYDKRSTTKW